MSDTLLAAGNRNEQTGQKLLPSRSLHSNREVEDYYQDKYVLCWEVMSTKEKNKTGFGTCRRLLFS